MFQKKLIWDYRRINIDLFIELLLNVNWEIILSKGVNEATELFTQAIKNAAHQSIPQQVLKTHKKDKPWVTRELKIEIRKRNRLFKRAKNFQSQHSWETWRLQRNKVTDINRHLKTQYIRNQVNKLIENKQDPRRYHQTLKNLLSKTEFSYIPPLEGAGGELCTDDISKANVLNAYFAAQSTNDQNDQQVPHCEVEGRDIPVLSQIVVTENDVLSILNRLNVNKSCGSDKIPNKILKLAGILIKEPLTKLFNKSLEQGVYPDMWKHANITPIFKHKGSSSDPKNYRPISLLPNISKILEKVVFDKIYKHITFHGLITERQSGYRPHHGTQAQLVYLTHRLYSALDKDMDFTTIYLDISRYFDRIWHQGLLKKCKHHFGITGNLLKWLTSYLENRTHCVHINGTYSSVRTINASCPQGSVLGPLLALIYLNDLDGVTDNDLFFFADDTILFKSHPHNTDIAVTSLQTDIDKIKAYGDKWGIKFNSSKTIQQTFTNRRTKNPPALRFGDIAIPAVEKHKHLGLTISTSLRFHDHVNDIIKKVNGTLGPLYPIAKFIPRQVLSQIYCTYIRPFFDYSDIVYNGHLTVADATRLERLQNRAARLVTGALSRTPTVKVLADLGWTTLRTRREINSASYLYKTMDPRFRAPDYLKNILPATREQIAHHTLRNPTNISIPSSRLSSYRNSFIPCAVRTWNRLSHDTRSQPTLYAFKRAVMRECGIQKPPLFFSYGSKVNNILHTRLRLESSLLKAHLFSLYPTKVQSAACACGFSFETNNHFFFHCPLYQVPRADLIRTLNNIIHNFSHMTVKQKLDVILCGQGLGTSDGLAVARTVQMFIVKSQRFS